MTVTLITGASSGIGAALARRYAQAEATLVLVARDAARLEAVAAECRALGAAVETERLDVRDRAATRAVIAAVDARHPLDRVIVNAAINGGHPTGDLETEEVAFETIDINLVGAMNVALPAVTLMSARGRGQIALISSLAAYAPLPDAPAYSGAKAALLAHGLALREKLRARGVKVSVVTPGYVKTPMGGDYKGWRPMEMSADEAAARIVKGLERDRDVVAFPWLMFHAARGASLLPEALRRLGMHGFRFQIRRRP
ncbi:MULTISPECIES: SDR family NAD(P)-dependent oxidoreductase [Methylobacterium]|uniref:Oxidoreductase n=1 Tax=Methylobacterium jeotgali TaxID=381630 RepID=A0ABQ4T243_9HYPH|nr:MULTISPECIES: SDR family NAD(P)-dependent oxidoreductase [Methylobacterium]PIU06718.1 MAG: short-chain dehydrogenase [Methylobacterium sp. CG09_land_8_20_14_0_10_71_15]PIU15866.1 MAG: short-chain dehydrogenase [Methylobacterium sp. CG08_land_8_20_14_0_20_71_15]GBU19729.1 oxidoreductase [Methylobacterium sp.]GJE08860.1 putative oxidoreductase [Methylobacterium jeotgali]